MVFILPGHIVADGLEIRGADGEDAITSLPGKTPQPTFISSTPGGLAACTRLVSLS